MDDQPKGKLLRFPMSALEGADGILVEDIQRRIMDQISQFRTRMLDEPMAILLGPREFLALCCSVTSDGEALREVTQFAGYPVKLMTTRGVDLVARRCQASRLAREAYGADNEGD